MSKHNNGGPAFPLTFDPHNATNVPSGMSLRDYFAAKAVHVLASEMSWGHMRISDSELMRVWAKSAYDLADAMLYARQEGQS